MSKATCKKIIDCTAQAQGIASCLAGTAVLGVDPTPDEALKLSKHLIKAKKVADKMMDRMVKEGGYKDELEALEARAWETGF